MSKDANQVKNKNKLPVLTPQPPLPSIIPMKPIKPTSHRAGHRRAALPLAFTLVLALSGAAPAAVIYWDNSGGTVNSWASSANWDGNVAGNTTPAAVPGISDVATFRATPIQGTAQTINLDANQSVLGLDILSGVTANTTLASGGTARTLTIGASGIINAGSGVVTIGNTAGGGASVNVVFAGSQSIANNGSGNIFLNNNITGTGSPTITNNGTGTGQVLFFGSDLINNTVSGFVQDSATSTLRLRSIGVNTFSGGVVIRKGTVNFGNAASNLGTGTVTLGNGSGGSDAATLDVSDNSNQSFANAIALASSTTGTLTIRLTEDAVATSHSKTFTGGITGPNSLTIQNNGGTGAGPDTLTFTTGPINNAGTLTHIGTGTGNTTISAVIGSNVTGVTQNSASSTLVLSGSNSFTGTTTINAGVLAVTGGAAIPNTGTVTLANVAGATFSVQTSETIGSLQGGGAIGGNVSILSGQTLTVAETGSQTFAGVISNSGSLTKTGIGTLTLTGLNTYSGATTLSAGALQVGSSGAGRTGTGAVTVQSGSTLLGTGTVRGTTFTLANGGTLRPGDSVANSSHGTLTYQPAAASGSTSSLQGSIILGITTATTTDPTFGGNAIGTIGYNAWVDGITGVGSHDRLVFNNPTSGTGYNLNFLTTTGNLEVVGDSFTPAMGQVFNLADWNFTGLLDFVGFTFASGYLTGNGDEGVDLNLPNISASGLAWDFSRFTTSGNIVVIPEPSRALLMMFGLAGLALRRRRQVNRA